MYIIDNEVVRNEGKLKALMKELFNEEVVIESNDKSVNRGYSTASWNLVRINNILLRSNNKYIYNSQVYNLF